jgi:hypothetical protein
MTTEYVSSVGGFLSGGGNGGGLGDFYAGALARLPGIGSGAGFQIAALFMPTGDPGGVEHTLWSNTSGLNGWALKTRLSSVTTAPPNALEVVVAVNGVDDVVATVLNAYPGVPMLVHAFIVDSGNNRNVLLFINGMFAASALAVTGIYVPSPDAPVVGALGPAAGPTAFATQTRILGVMYHAGASPLDVTPASFYTACREAKDMVWGLDTTGGAPVSPNSDFTNRYSVRENISASAVAPATWVPSTGSVNLTRTSNGVQALDVRAHKNLDWHAALFATAAP